VAGVILDALGYDIPPGTCHEVVDGRLKLIETLKPPEPPAPDRGVALATINDRLHVLDEDEDAANYHAFVTRL
jgi:hypothetical protein